MRVVVQQGSGAAAHFSDHGYQVAGAEIVQGVPAVLERAETLLKVRAPSDQEFALLPEGCLLISLGGRDARVEERVRQRGITHLGLERLPRISRAQEMDVLSTQATIAGYAAVLLGSARISTLMPMMSTAAGTVRPAKVLVVGAGVAGLQAVATARRLGARVFGFDIRLAAGEQIESLGATFIKPDWLTPDAEGAGGYAHEQSEDEQSSAIRTLSEHLPEMNLVITTAQVPGRPAPCLIEAKGVAVMPNGAVLVDLAAEGGGNCALTRPDAEVVHEGVTVLGPTNLPSAHATDARRLFGGNMRALLTHLSREGGIALDETDPITVALLGHKPSAIITPTVA
ncbi:MAG: NAD(P)(+) transhydrogenase (Re/Si-specific) subunit alpha [Alphaproteobacteria bacterium]|nr:NAD(P)(+) transhydrogenase (Re/Si-specific) subunit alpha [Alphaproteobacteria bacterium]